MALIIWQVGVVSAVPPVVLMQNGTIILRDSYLLQDQEFVVVSSTNTETSPMTYLYAGIYFIVTIAYSIGASLSFRPKRIVSPLNIQIVTIVFMAVILASPFIIFTSPSIVNLTAIQNVAQTLFIFGFFMVIAGVAQTRIVAYLVGLNGAETDLDRRTYLINAPFETVLKILKRKDIMNLRDFRVTRETDKILMIKSRANKLEQLIVYLTTDEESTRSLLATAAYESKFTSVVKTDNASAIRDSVLLYINNQLEVKGIKMMPLDNGFLDPASINATKEALKNTQPQFADVKDMSPLYRKIVYLTVIAFGAMTAAWIFNVIDQTQYTQFLGLLGIELLFVFIPLAKRSGVKNKAPVVV